MARADSLNVDLQGMADVEAQLAMASLPQKLKLRLLNRVSQRIRTQWRKRVREQHDLNGEAFTPRKKKRKGQKAKMLGGLAAGISVTRLNDKGAELGWGSSKAAMIANVHNSGISQRRTAAQMRNQTRNKPTQATKGQAKRLRRLGFKVRLPSTSKRKKVRWMKPGVAWITDNLKYDQAGLLIKILSDEPAGPSSWEINLPKREFFGVASDQEVMELISYLLPQILNSPR